MKVSIIVPAYNAEKTISKCLDSIINQTYRNIEIIVINDGSTDLTGKIIFEYAKKDNRIIVIDNENHGVSYSRNCGVKIASGDYITFIDSDDYLNNDAYETFLPYMKKKLEFIRYNFKVDGLDGFNNNIYDLANKQYILDNENLNKLYSYFFTSRKKIPCLVMLLLIRKDIAKKIKFNEKLTMMEDVDYYMQLFNISKKCYFVDEKKYNYYINPDSITHSKKTYKKNIFGILDTNMSLKEKIRNDFSYIIPEINANHLRIIYSFLKQTYKYDKKEYKKIVNELNTNNCFKKIINDSKHTKINIRFYYYFMKKKLIIFENLYFLLFNIYEKFKRR